jgi:hypothetical protein
MGLVKIRYVNKPIWDLGGGIFESDGLCRRHKAKAPNEGENAGNLFERTRVLPRPEFGTEAVLIAPAQGGKSPRLKNPLQNYMPELRYRSKRL